MSGVSLTCGRCQECQTTDPEPAAGVNDGPRIRFRDGADDAPDESKGSPPCSGGTPTQPEENR